MNSDPLYPAKVFAATKHKDQKYGNGLPYMHHLASVEKVLRRFGRNDEHLLNAAYLHDTIEDTGTKPEEIEQHFGPKVASLVSAVTNEPGINRKARAALTYPKIRSAGSDAVALKLADRIANVEHGGSLVKMYQKEHKDFKQALYAPNEHEDMWAHLDKLMA